MTAQPASFYDQRYQRSPLAWHDSPELPLYEEAIRWLPASAFVIDLGCGLGHFGAAFAAHGHRGRYLGVDFSSVAIDAARDAVPAGAFTIADLAEWLPPPDLGDAVFVILETLEHVPFDLGLLRKIPPGRRVVFSVPGFDHPGHVRYFPALGLVFDRYAGLLDLGRWSLIRPSQTGVLHLFDSHRKAEAW